MHLNNSAMLCVQALPHLCTNQKCENVGGKITHKRNARAFRVKSLRFSQKGLYSKHVLFAIIFFKLIFDFFWFFLPIVIKDYASRELVGEFGILLHYIYDQLFLCW